VAIKLLTVCQTDEDRQAFLNEAHSLAELSHPHIIRIFDYNIHSASGVPYLVMDYAPHGTLRKRHPTGFVVPLTQIVIYVRQIADGLQYAHDHKFIHRDIRPENLLIGKNNEILLSDFGIAFQYTITKSLILQEVAGRASYMAPEQFNGQLHEASDQYALGVVAYEWLSGSCPYKGSFSEIVSQHMFSEIPPLREKNPALSPEVEQVIQIALTKEPQLRFASVSAFANALQEAASITKKNPVPSWPNISDQHTPLIAPRSLSDSKEREAPILITQTSPSLPPSSIPPTASGETPVDAKPTKRSDPITPFPATYPEFLQPRTGADELAQQAPPALDTFVVSPGRKPFLSRRSLVIAGVTTLGVAGTLGGIWLWLQSGGVLHPTSTVPPATTVSSKWTLFGANPEHTHVIPDEQKLSTTTVKNLKERWRTSLGGSISFSSPLTIDNVLYVGSTNFNFYALNANDGRQLWKFETGSSIYSSPAYDRDRIYFGSVDHSVYAISKAGKLVWKFPTQGGIFSSPLIVNGILYVGSWDSQFYALDAATGKKIWSTATGNSIMSSAAFANNTVFFGSNDKNIYALNATTGEVRWKVLTGDEVVASPSVVDGVAYIGSKDAYLYALDALSGEKLWTAPTYGQIQSSPAVWNNSIYVGSKGASLWAFSKNGDLLWQKSISQEIASSPTIANGIIYVGAWDGNIYALDMGNKGNILWHGPTSDAIDSSPTLAQGNVYIGSHDGSVYAYGL
jgi:outer membrane protein assembly factor BamB